MIILPFRFSLSNHSLFYKHKSNHNKTRKGNIYNSKPITVTSSSSPSLTTLTVSPITHGQFEFSSNPNTAITSFTYKLHITFKKISPLTVVNSFTLTDITSGNIEAITLPPSSSLALSDGSDSISATPASITFLLLPTLTQAKITIKIGRSVTLDQSMIVATVASTLTLTFSVSNVLYSKFVLNTDPSVTITCFTLDQIQADIVDFIQDGSINTPSFTIPITFIPLPVITKNVLTIKQSKTVFISPSIIYGSGATGLTITFTVSNNLNINFI